MSVKMSTPEQSLVRNFEISYRLCEKIGLNALDRNYRPNWRTVYPGTVNVFALVQLLYLLGTERADLLQFLLILPHFLFTAQGFHKFILCTRRSSKIFALRCKLTEIQALLLETKSSGPVICRTLNISRLLQTLIFVFYLASVVLTILVPTMLWLVIGKKTFMFLFFVPGFDQYSTEGFLVNTILHAVILLAAFHAYTGYECLFLGMIMPVGAYVDAFGNEVQELNSVLSLKERNDPAIRARLNRIVKLHQLMNEYKAMLEELYNVLILSTIGLNYLGIISTIVVILKSNDRMAYIFFALMFEILFRICLMGTIITVKNDQLVGHLYNIEWYQLAPDQAKDLRFMLHQAQNPTSVTIGKYALLNLEGYMSVLKSIYSYVMVLVTVLE
ncbi:putative odorant receptor 83c [Culex pipiens pallens]|uniref:putative odorant receptor 83c n=1 Tax=Culex pipiens pallens TaxID=42434 RepID=UPI0019548D99|nr:putative odorant receptor 83c [Culex pipiens pallens]